MFAWIGVVLAVVALALAAFCFYKVRSIEKRVDLTAVFSAECTQGIDQSRQAIREMQGRVNTLADALIGVYPEQWPEAALGEDYPTMEKSVEQVKSTPVPDKPAEAAAAAPLFGNGLGIMLSTVMNTMMSNAAAASTEDAPAPAPAVEEMPDDASEAVADDPQ